MGLFSKKKKDGEDVSKPSKFSRNVGHAADTAFASSGKKRPAMPTKKRSKPRVEPDAPIRAIEPPVDPRKIKARPSHSLEFSRTEDADKSAHAKGDSGPPDPFENPDKLDEGDADV